MKWVNKLEEEMELFGWTGRREQAERGEKERNRKE